MPDGVPRRGPRAARSDSQGQQGEGAPDGSRVRAEVVADEQEGVPELEVADDLALGVAWIVDHGAPDDPHLPAGAPGPHRQVRLLAVGEVALVEQADLLQRSSSGHQQGAVGEVGVLPAVAGDRKSTRLNSSHRTISYAVFCLKKKNHRKSRMP